MTRAELKARTSQIISAFPTLKEHDYGWSEIEKMLNEILIELDDIDWHTGTPTEEGEYFVAFRWGLDNKIMHDMAVHIQYGATEFFNGNWKIEFPYVVLAWIPIEPYKEENNG